MVEPEPGRERAALHAAGWVLGWVAAAGAAVAVGVFAVTSVGATIRDRGPTVNEAIREAQINDQTEGVSVVPTDEPAERVSFEQPFGTFTVECRGAVASTVDVVAAAGWRVASYDQGPDDDVDATFRAPGRAAEIEVYCARGAPVVAEVEWQNASDDED